MYQTYFNSRWTEGNVPLFGAMDNSVWMGSSVFDGARSICGNTPDLQLHLERLIKSANRLGMDCPYNIDEMLALCHIGIKRFPADAHLYIRPLVFATDGFLIPIAEKAQFALTLFDAAFPAFTGFSACLSTFRRPDPLMAPTDAKASSLYPNTIRALREAASRAYDNAVICDPDGNVAEFSTANLFFVSAEGAVVTPAPNGTFLVGITRARVIALLAEAGITVEERAVKPEELETAIEIFSTGNFGKVMPCTRYQTRSLAIGPVATLAKERYMAFMENKLA